MKFIYLLHFNWVQDRQRKILLASMYIVIIFLLNNELYIYLLLVAIINERNISDAGAEVNGVKLEIRDSKNKNCIVWKP